MFAYNNCKTRGMRTGMLSKKEIINKLNLFYSLELTQVDLYIAQSKNVKQIYIKKALEKFAIIEQDHVDNVADKIKELGGDPTFVGDKIAPIIGKAMGKITNSIGIANMYKTNIYLERNALKHYKNFIQSSGKNKDLQDLLWSNCIEEDLHATWFAYQIEKNKP
jgi:bacterioferritin